MKERHGACQRHHAASRFSTALASGKSTQNEQSNAYKNSTPVPDGKTDWQTTVVMHMSLCRCFLCSDNDWFKPSLRSTAK
jgi:hypothetical protein